MTHMYFVARAEGRISYGHLGRINSCFLRFSTRALHLPRRCRLVSYSSPQRGHIGSSSFIKSLKIDHSDTIFSKVKCRLSVLCPVRRPRFSSLFVTILLHILHSECCYFAEAALLVDNSECFSTFCSVLEPTISKRCSSHSWRRVLNIQLIRTNYVPEHSWDRANSEYVSFVG